MKDDLPNTWQLSEWRRLVDVEIARWEQSGAVHPLCEDPDVFVFKCIADALTAREAIEAAVEQFIRTGTWPDDVTDEHVIYLLHRALAARVLLDHLILNPAAVPQFRPPSVNNRSAFLRWLFVTTWNIGGAEYMKIWADDYLAKNPPPRTIAQNL